MKIFFGVLALFIFLSPSQEAFAKNMHVIDQNASGFSVVRTGKPSQKDFRKLCAMGVRRMIVMSGNGSIERGYAAKECPGFEVIYDQKQSTLVPLSEDFLNFFDAEVEKAKQGNYGVAFRCNCGCHRTGRLAAYYRMKHEGMSAKAALYDQRKKATFLIPKLLYRKTLKYQIRALKDYIDGRGCQQRSKYCVAPHDRAILPDEADIDDLE